ncbi:uncharacterized protein N7483_001900 [Penicillium malachiteum]|uniref:uncharacterized protein n=1 Tax=Penicillium malachiteum TaxID=1324776 RepID=UPI002547FE23|nr:uncharacterized protein N7483_001900 [Penicillium malachiteum]KAJ5736775.1 hypothetical protein N7483_001900 [Penicillium malachiteum]
MEYQLHRSFCFFGASFLILPLLLELAAATIPYTPSSIFLSPQHNDSLAYIFRPSSSNGRTEFLSLNVSSTISSNSSFHTLLPEAPFQNADQIYPYLPVIDDNGTITLYTGICNTSVDRQEIWQFRSQNTSSTGNGTWSQFLIEGGGDKTRPNYLSAGFTFASTNTSNTSMYSFGGMCPLANSTDQNWVSAANYSQSMVALDPASGSVSTTYDVSTTGTRAPPIPEAGMAIVPLLPTFSRTEVQQDFLLIGGHTQHAFLNMSELAVFSLPQNSWSFIQVQSEEKTRTELAIRDQFWKIFVIGGWVGDTSEPADPQIAVLDIGEGYGGSGDWTWTTSSSSSSDVGIAEGTGLYGHSATMLPGGVLMIVGGYTIPKQSSKRSSSETNSKVYLYNSTSGDWVKSYTNPSSKKSTSTTSHGHHLSPGQKIGLGIGLGLGIPLAIVLLICAWKYNRTRQTRGLRDSQLRELALGAERAHFWGRDDPLQASSIRSSQMSEKLDPAIVYPWAGNRSVTAGPPWKDQAEGSENTGLLADVPSPVKNNRSDNRPPSITKSYRMSGYTDWRRSDTPSECHPIDEREEDEAIFRERLMATIPNEEWAKIQDTDDDISEASFATPRSTIFGVGLGPFYTKRKDMGASNLDVAGRVSPTRSDRTSTNLSESSAFSFSSKPTGQIPQSRAIYVDRPLSWVSSGDHSFEGMAAGSTHSRETSQSDVDGATAPSEKSFSADSYSTAQTTIAERQAENTSLLFDADSPIDTSLSKLPPSSKPRTSDWMFQTVRRALTLTRRSPVEQEEPETETAQLASGIDLVLVPPRRAVSASAELFRRKQGAKDWNAKKRLSDNFTTARSTRDDLFLGAPGYLGDDHTVDDEDWDVEGAAEGRSVQVTYTVPREKLRVVNASAADNLSERSVSRNVSGGTVSRRVSG